MPQVDQTLTRGPKDMAKVARETLTDPVNQFDAADPTFL